MARTVGTALGFGLAPMPEATFSDEWLVQSLEGLVDAERLAELRGKADPAKTLWETLVAAKTCTDEQILGKLAARFRMKVADAAQIDPKVREAVPETLARRYRILPLRMTDSYLEVGTANPFDMHAEKDLAFATAREVRLLLLAPSQINLRLDELYRPDKAINKLLSGMESSGDLVQLTEQAPVEEIKVTEEEASQRPVVRLVDLIISEGIQSRASDIHVEPEEGGVAVRYRIDGVLRQVMKIPRQAGLPLISRIKIMSSLDIADRLRPQDGRARVAVGGQPIDLRVSTLPAALGEKVVIRILDSRATVKSLDSLGLNAGEGEAIRALLGNHEGVILVTGPTGSGKTTTLYSMINQIKSEGVNIVTVEDPVEYRMAGIVQVQVQEKAGLTFAAALRSILRQDPNVVLVGEIRDRETAMIAVQASLTGHLVLSTLHTNDAANAVTRLVDIGVEAYKIAAALRGVIAQRLMRKLCPTCKQVWMEAPAERLKKWLPKETPLYRAAGRALRAAGGAGAGSRLRRPRAPRAEGAARGRRGQPPQGDQGVAGAGRLRRGGGARRRAGARPDRPRGAGHHRPRPQHARPRRLRRALPPALAARHGGHPGDRADRQGRRGQRGPGVRTRRRRFPDEAVPGPRALGAARSGPGPPPLSFVSHDTRACPPGPHRGRPPGLPCGRGRAGQHQAGSPRATGVHAHGSRGGAQAQPEREPVRRPGRREGRRAGGRARRSLEPLSAVLASRAVGAARPDRK